MIKPMNICMGNTGYLQTYAHRTIFSFVCLSYNNIYICMYAIRNTYLCKRVLCDMYIKESRL